MQINEQNERLVLLQREREEANVVTKLSAFDTERRKLKLPPTKVLPEPSPLEDFDGNPISEAVVLYVQPYLTLLRKTLNDLTPDEAIAIKQACLASFRTRLESKEQVLLNHITTTTQNHRKHIQTFASQYEGTGAEPEKEVLEQHKIFLETSAFTLNVFEQRLKKHEIDSPKLFVDLEANLSAYLKIRK